MKKVLFFALFFCFFVSKMNAQLVVDAGEDKKVCIRTYGVQDTYRLGATPTIRGGVAPYRVEWSTDFVRSGRYRIYASRMLTDTTTTNPMIRMGLSDLDNLSEVVFRLKVTDANQNVSTDSVRVQFSRFSYLLGYCVRNIQAGDSAIVTPTVGGGIPPLTYIWSPNYNITATNVPSPSVFPRQYTQYSAALKDVAGCVSDFNLSCIFYVNGTATTDLTNTYSVSIAPNPIVSTSQLTINDDSNQEKSLTIFNSVGQSIYSQKMTSNQVNIGKLIAANGVYFYQIANHEKVLASGKFLSEQ